MVLNQFSNIGGLNARHMARARLTPVPLPRAARKDLGILKSWMALDLYVAPGKVRDTWGIGLYVAHVFNQASLVQNKGKRSYLRQVEHRTHVSTLCQRTLCRLDLGYPVG